MEKDPAVYMMANKQNGTLYTGVTRDLVSRVYQHKDAQVPCFTSKYSCKLLVYSGAPSRTLVLFQHKEA